MKLSVVIVCGGSSSRFKAESNKVLAELAGKPVFMHSVDLLSGYSDDIIVVAGKSVLEEIRKYTDNVVLGGDTRMDSVYNGVTKARYDYVLVHDGARPYLLRNDVEKIVDEISFGKVVYLGTAVVNTLRKIDSKEIIDRDDFINVATPQCFPKDDFLRAYNLAKQDGLSFTDDVALFEKYTDLPVSWVRGTGANTKITTQSDLMPDYRIGHSWDVHRLVEDRLLILGGIKIPFEKGLLGHSDADCLLHAIAEALLGSVALGDLGTHYSDKDSKNEGMDSSVMLKECYKLVQEKGYFIKNIDCMVYCEEPKLAKYIHEIRSNIASILDVEINLVSLKATTYEKLGEIGRGLAIASEAVVLVYKK